MRSLSILLALGVVGCSVPGHTAAGGGEPPAPVALDPLFPLATGSEGELCRQLAQRQLLWRDPQTKLRRKVIVSDIHLGPGHSDPRFAGLEDFEFDGVFKRFIASQAARGPTDLIVAGDFIEFWQIEGALGLPPGASQQDAMLAIEVAIAAHPQVFAALSSFLTAGDNRLILIAGNHDAELIWPQVRLRIARELRVSDLSNLLFVDALAYRHGGVHIEHGHRFDGANMTRDLNDAVVLDDAGVCRVQSVWGELFLAEVFNKLEQQYPFVDNLSPNSAALMWGLRDEPDKMRVAGAAAQFANLLLSEDKAELNQKALRAALLETVGSPFKSKDEARLRDLLWDAMPSSDGALTVVARLLVEDQYAPLRSQLVGVLDASYSATAVWDALRKLDLTLLSRLLGGLVRDPYEVAAQAIANARIVVLAHTHAPGGTLRTLDDGRVYANTGAWVPSQSVDGLKAQGLTWTELDGTNRAQFPAAFPAIIVEYSPSGTPAAKLLRYK